MNDQPVQPNHHDVQPLSKSNNRMESGKNEDEMHIV
jgi:hypothetical protein